MKNKIFKMLSVPFAPVFSGAMIVLAFPNYDLELLAWVGLIPLLVTLYGRGPIYGFFLAFVFGVSVIAGTYSWALEINGFTLLHHTVIVSFLGLLFGLFGLTFSFLSRRMSGNALFFVTPFVWICVEYLRSNLGFLSLPWALLAHTQYQNTTIIQIASLVGAYGVSFLIILVNAALSAAILSFYFPSKISGSSNKILPTRRGTASLMVITATLISLALLYGENALSRPAADKVVRVAVVQGNIPQEKKWDPKYANFIMQRYADLTWSASKDEPALIVWPEAATPGLVLKDMPLLNQLVTLAKQSRTHLLIGSTEYPKFPDDSAKLRRAGNTAVYFSPEGKVAGQYLKIRSVPFGEYLPFEGKIRWPRFIVPDPNANYEIPGKEFTLFELEGHKFGVAICWESHFPGLFRQFVRQGAKFMLNIANEGRYGETAASAQMLAINQFRAIENRISIARATNTGISCFIDPFGRVMSRIYDNGRDIFIKGYLTQEISLLQKRSFYTNYGYIFVYLNIIAAGLMIFLSLIRGKKNRII